jgi:hypothetical protein
MASKDNIALLDKRLIIGHPLKRERFFAFPAQTVVAPVPKR